MLKKIFIISLVLLYVVTQTASAMEFQPVMAQPIPALAAQVPSDIFKNENPSSVSGAFSFFKISDSVVTAVAIFGNNAFAQTLDLLNPISDFLDVTEFMEDPGQKLQDIFGADDESGEDLCAK